MDDYANWLLSLGLAMMRPYGMLLILPIFTARSLGSSLLRNGLVFAIALPMMPVFFPNPPIVHESLTTWIGFLCIELMIGVILGFIAALPFWAIDMAGFLIDTLRGATMSTLFNPSMGMESSIFGVLFTQLLTVLFLLSGGFNLVLAALYGSYDALPIGSGIHSSPAMLQFLQSEWQLMYELCLSFALPAILVMVLADLCLGLINRSAQQLNVFFLAMPIKSALALLLLLISLPYALDHYLVGIKHTEQKLSTLTPLMNKGDL
ncbi:type III secretion system export apparatus subunit SctT [Yersinia massiliensis]|uniref:EscT/YscT/HrcT family type III secretion system export apparatus protein n=2 Tax=Yersinia TaxID=629 RepID=A0A2R4NUZ1_9GAMM|nr:MULTISPECIES: type III secretion system export apparatus subunit SctT [Yersinia]HEC1649110.1 type III secretion system export apparatus subunit SctT [Yersinia enterocolitica]ATM88308.1 EscT/YscT/HrcT family type III secretion system export apparatus protein [Yersinia frederiksenii]AVX39923.1 EscT/YscT/HrcT family type III secretion system export apparatus protein [Yersinia massiliensis]MCB5317042.1 type III secretion system export apparatus subunit SctT [Yersinia massiliensis]MDA5549059.1 t